MATMPVPMLTPAVKRPPLTQVPIVRLLRPDVATRASADEPVCFRNDERFRCREEDCSWRSDCHRLVAEWRR